MTRGGLHDPLPRPHQREITRARRRIAKLERHLEHWQDSHAPTARATRRALQRQLADARAYLEHLESCRSE